MMRAWRRRWVVIAAVAFLAGAAQSAEYYPLRGVTDPAGELEALAERCKENPTPELQTTTGWLLHLCRNDNEEARGLFEKALDSQPGNAWARYGLCLIDEIEGDFNSMLSNSLALCESHPSHPLALLAVLNIRSLFGGIGHFHERVESVLRTLLAEGRSGSIQFDEICREILSATSRSRGDAEGLKRLVEDGGYVNEWRVVGSFGEFENLSFLSKWKPESDSRLKSRYKIGERVVKTKHYSTEYGRIRPHWVKRGLYYAEAFLCSASSQEVVVRISSHTAVEVFLNNRRIYSKDAIRSYGPITDYVRTRLSPGYNRLVLKFLEGGWASYSRDGAYKDLRSESIAWELAARSPAVQVFGYPHGSAAVSVSTSARRWRQVKEVDHSEYKPLALRYFSELLNENGEDPLALGTCGILKSVQGDSQGAKRLLLSAVKHVPSYCYFNYVLGDILENDPSLPMQIRRSEAGSRFRSALAAAKMFPLPLYETALLDIQEDKELEAIEKLNQCVARCPEFLSWHESLYGVYKKKEWQEERRGELATILGLGVETFAPYRLAEEYYRYTRQYDRLAEVIEKLQRTDVNAEFLARYYSESGRDAEATTEYLKLKSAQPEKESIRMSLIELYERNKRWAEAEREIKESLKLFPKNLWFLKELAQVRGHAGRWRGERRAWKEVLREHPVDRDARRAVEAYGEKDMLDEFDIDSWPYIQDESIREKYAGVSSAIIIDQLVEEIYPNCSGRQKTHQLILLNDKKAIDEWGELDVPEDELLELRTVKKDGTIVEPEHPEGSKGTVSMGGLQEGDFIEYKYITRTWSGEDRPRRYLGARFFFQSVDTPMELSQYVVIFPEKMKLEYEQLNFSESPSVSRRKGRKIYKWEARSVAAMPEEPLAPRETEFLPFVRVGVNYDEDAEILRYQDHNVAMAKITDEIGDATARILADCPGDVESRIRAIYSFVSKEVRGGGGSAFLTRSGSETLADRRGDRLSLAKAMLDAANIECRMVVVRPQLSHASKVFPGSFISALLGIQDGEGRYIGFLDLGSRYLPFGYVRSSLQEGIAVPLQNFSCPDFGLGDGERELYVERFTMPRFPITDNCEQRTLKASVGEDGSVEGVQLQEYTGDAGASLREGLMTAESYQVRDFIERMANITFRGAALTYHKVGELSDPEKPLLIEFGFKAPNFARIAGKEMLLDQWLPLLRLGARFAALDARESPLEISREFNTRFRGEIKVPAGAEVAVTPSPLNLETDLGFYRLQVSKRDGSISIENDFHLKAQRISPGDYPRLVEFCRAVDAAERKEIRIQLGP